MAPATWIAAATSRHLSGLIGLIGEHRVVGAGRPQPRPRSDAVDLAAMTDAGLPPAVENT